VTPVARIGELAGVKAGVSAGHRRVCLGALILAIAAAGCETAPPSTSPAPLPPPKAPAPPAQPVPLAPAPAAPPPGGPPGAPAHPAAPSPPSSPSSPPPAARYPQIKPGDYRYATAGGATRYYGLHVPTGYDGTRALPVVIVLHGRGGSAVTANTFGFSENADRDGFFAVYPEAVPPARMWFTGLEVGPHSADDVAYVRQLLAELSDLVYVDPRRIYAVGYSNGGTLAAHLAGALPGRIAAVATVDANIAIRDRKGVLTTVAKPAQPVSALFIHGRLDHASPYAGGPSPVLGGNNAVGARDGVSWWAEAMGCNATPKSVRHGETERLVYADCRDNVTVQLTSYGGGHDWPKTLPLDTAQAPRPADYILDFFSGTGDFKRRPTLPFNAARREP